MTEPLEYTEGRNENGTRYVAFEVAGWSVVAQEEPGQEGLSGAHLWSVHLLPEDYQRHANWFRGFAPMWRHEAIEAARLVATALNHVANENALLGTGGRYEP